MARTKFEHVRQLLRSIAEEYPAVFLVEINSLRPIAREALDALRPEVRAALAAQRKAALAAMPRKKKTGRPPGAKNKRRRGEPAPPKSGRRGRIPGAKNRHPGRSRAEILMSQQEELHSLLAGSEA